MMTFLVVHVTFRLITTVTRKYEKLSVDNHMMNYKNQCTIFGNITTNLVIQTNNTHLYTEELSTSKDNNTTVHQS